MLKRITALLIAVVLLCGLSVSAFAHDAVQLDRDCSIRVTMHSEDAAVGGGTLTVYRVGDVLEDDGDYSFGPSAEFAASGETLADITETALAARLAAWVEKNLDQVSGVTKEIPASGTVVFENLKPGLYLFMQFKAASGYERVTAFLVSVPVMRDGTYYYDLDATPKMSPVTAVTPTPPPAPTPTPTPTLPQTGQLNWPIPVLVICGLVLCTVGWALRRSGKKDENAE